MRRSRCIVYRMKGTRMRRRVSILIAVVGGLLALAPAASARQTPFTTIFGIDTGPKGGLLVADAGQGIMRGRGDAARVVVPLPGVTDVDVRTKGSFWAIASDMWLYRTSGDRAIRVANLGAFERRVNPHPATTESNPFDVESLGATRALVADAAGNDVLVVNKDGRIRVVAVLPNQLVSTANAKRIAGCPNAPPDFAFVCDLPARIPAEPVATSVTRGPDGAIYIGELKGFPAPLHRSRIWRVEPGARNVHCGKSPDCRAVVHGGLTSIIDLRFHAGKVYAAQIDDKSWLALEAGSGIGGSVRACDVTTGECEAVVDGLPILTSITFRGGALWGAINALIPGVADVVPLASAGGSAAPAVSARALATLTHR